VDFVSEALYPLSISDSIMATDDETSQAFDPNRRLCPDGACIGVLARDGKCPICGTTGPAASSDEPSPPPYTETDRGDEPPVEDDHASPPAGVSDSDGTFDPRRKLCSDESCVGVIGPDGRCSECGSRG
jgi:hypothetical protein